MNREVEHAEGSTEGNFLVPKAMIGVLWRRLWVIVAITTLLVGVNFGFAAWQTPTYESSLRLLIAQQNSTEASMTNLSGTVDGLQQLTQTLAEAAADRPVAVEAAEMLNQRVSAGQIMANLSVQQVGETQFIEISYESTDPDQAQQIAGAVGDAFSQQVAEISPSVGNVTATTWSPASSPADASAADPVVGTLMALLLGVTLGCVLAFLLEYLDDKWRSVAELEQASGLPNLGVVPKPSKTAGGEKSNRGPVASLLRLKEGPS